MSLATNVAVTRTFDLADDRSILVWLGLSPGGVARVLLVLCDVSGMKQLVNRAQGAGARAARLG